MRDKLGRFKKGYKPSIQIYQNWIRAIKKSAKKRRKKKEKLFCLFCHRVFFVLPCRKNIAKFCSKRCRSIKTGEIRRRNAVPIFHSGYMFIKMPSYHRANKMGYAKIADLVLEQKIGRSLNKKELAHHIDNCKTNDSPDNLQLMDSVEHSRFHLNQYR